MGFLAFKNCDEFIGEATYFSLLLVLLFLLLRPCEVGKGIAFNQ